MFAALIDNNEMGNVQLLLSAYSVTLMIMMMMIIIIIILLDAECKDKDISASYSIVKH